MVWPWQHGRASISLVGFSVFSKALGEDFPPRKRGWDRGEMKGGEGSGLLIDGNGGDAMSQLGRACECFHHGDPPIMGG